MIGVALQSEINQRRMVLKSVSVPPLLKLQQSGLLAPLNALEKVPD